MKLTNGDLYVSREAFQRLIERDDIPVRYAFEIVKLVKKLNLDLVAIEDQRLGLIRKYGKEAKGQIKIEQGDDNFSKFVVDFNELMQIETEVVFIKVKIPDNIKITGQDLAALEPFIELITI